MTDKQKSQELGLRLKIHVCDWGFGYVNRNDVGSNKPKRHLCRKCKSTDWRNKNKDNFFTPEGQAVLAGALLNSDEDLQLGFSNYLTNRIPYFSSIKIIAETKLAELFYEFVESEKV